MSRAAPLVDRHPDVGAPIPSKPASLPMHVGGPQKVGTDSGVRRHAPPSPQTPLSANELVRPDAHRLSRAYKVHRTVNLVGDGKATAERARVFDLHRDVNEAVAIEVAELVDRIQDRGQPEALIETARAQRAIGPLGESAKGGARLLGTGWDGAEREGKKRHQAGQHICDTQLSRTPLERAGALNVRPLRLTQASHATATDLQRVA